MPGQVTWTGGASDGNWATAGNWSASGGSTPPANGDSVTIGAGDRDITSGLNQSGVTLASLRITEGFRFNIGDSSNALQINCSGNTNIVVAGSFIKINGTFNTASTAFTVRFKSAGQFAITGTILNLLLGGSGIVDVTSGCTVTNIHINGPTVTAAYNATGFTGAYVGSGRLTTYRNIASGAGAQGRLLLLSSAAITGTFITTPMFEISHQSSGTVAGVIAFPGGTYSPEGNTAGTATVTELIRYTGSTVVRDIGGVNLTATTERVV